MHLALLSTRLPAVISKGLEDPHFDDDWEASTFLYTRHQPNFASKYPEPTIIKPPISIVVAAIGPHLYFDPCHEELAVADAVIAVTVAHMTGRRAKVLAARTLDLPAASTTSSSSALAGETGFDGLEVGEGVWKPKRGGVKREVLIRAIEQCSKEGGVGEEILSALESFV